MQKPHVPFSSKRFTCSCLHFLIFSGSSLGWPKETGGDIPAEPKNKFYYTKQ